MTEKGEDNPRDMTPLRERYTLLNEADIEAYLGENPDLFETLIEAQKVGISYFPNCLFSLQLVTCNEWEFPSFLVFVHTPFMELNEALLRRENFDREWWKSPLEDQVHLYFTPLILEEYKEFYHANAT